MDKSITNVAVCYQIGIDHRFFSGDVFVSENFKKLSLVESFFNIKRDCDLQSRTLPNAKLRHR